MDEQVLARIYALVAEMEAIKVKVISYGTTEDTDTKYFQEAEMELYGISTELQTLGGLA